MIHNAPLRPVIPGSSPQDPPLENHGPAVLEMQLLLDLSKRSGIK